MDSTRIATTPLLGLRPLGGAGDRNYPSLTDILYKCLSTEHALLLAEPVPVPDGSRIDWYVPGSSRGVALASLPEDVKIPLEQRLARLQSAVHELAVQLEHEGPSGAALAKSLRNAMEIPGPEYVYAISGTRPDPADGPAYSPVLVAWGYAKDGAPSYAGSLKGRLVTPAAPVAMGEPPGRAAIAVAEPFVTTGAIRVQRRSLRWLTPLLWLLLAVFVALILWNLLLACGIGSRLGGYLGLSYCRASAANSADVERVRLLGVVHDLESQLARRQADCEVAAPGGSRAATPISPLPEATAEAERRVIERGGHQGDLQFTLTWEGHSDIDLAVTCPRGEMISTLNKAMCGGTLDLDANLGATSPGGLSQTPVEHITWPVGLNAPTGTYKIRVRYFGSHDDPRPVVPYRLVVTDRGRPGVTFEGSLERPDGNNRPEAVHEYTR